jgi:hypothetical protein
MSHPPTIDGVLVQWGDRLFYPGNRRVPAAPPAAAALRDRASAIRKRIQATVVRRAPQVMVKVTGGGRGMAAIAAHLRYISKAGHLPMEDDRGAREGKDAVLDLVDQWRLGGSRIPEQSPRREAFNIMLSMPRGTDPLTVQRAAREFAQAELAAHRYVMVLHTHQANPHVHLSVRAESKQGQRLNPRKADLQRWRETFAERLRSSGIEAEATTQATRGAQARSQQMWERKSIEPRLEARRPANKDGQGFRRNRAEATAAWLKIAQALSTSAEPADRQLAESIMRFVREMPVVQSVVRERGKEAQQELAGMTRRRVPEMQRTRSGPEIER